MKKQTIMTVLGLGLALSGADLFAQDEPRPRGEDRPRPPVPPIIAALDVNKDRVIDAEEIAQASKSLAQLDRNGDGKLTMEELMPPNRPPGLRPGPDGPRGEGRREGPPPEGRRPRPPRE